MSPQQLIHAVLYLPGISAEAVSKAIGVSLRERKEKESPRTKFFHSVGGAGFNLVTFKLSKTDPSWVLNCTYDLLSARHEAGAIEWSQFGPCIRDGLLPTMGPEGCSVHEFLYNGLIITFHVTVKSRVVYSLVLKRV